MQWVEPKVFKLGETTMNRDGVEAFLREIGAQEWMSKQPWEKAKSPAEYNSAEAILEIAGRTCYKSFGVGLNPNITKIREDSKEYIANVLKKGDGSIFEHPGLVWAFVDVSRVFCYSADTEVLTNEGWKAWPAVRGDELFASMSAEGELVYEPAEERFDEFYEGPMYQVQSQQVDLLVTPNHRMWVQEVDRQAYRRGEQPFTIRHAKDLLHKRVRYQKGGVFWRGESSDIVCLPETHRRYRRWDRPREVVRAYAGVSFQARPFSRFLGWFISEGNLGRPDTAINLTQNRGPFLNEIESTVRQLGFSPMNVRSGTSESRRITFKNVALYDWLEAQCDRGALQKHVPDLVMNWPPPLVLDFLGALIKGDGNVHPENGHVVLYTSSKALADDVQVLALKAGIAANIRVDNRVESHTISTGVTIRKTKPNYIVSFLKPSNLYPHVNQHLTSAWPNRFRAVDGYDDRMVHYAGRVYCVKVRHGLLYVRRNGKPCWSGNTHELVRHRAGTAISQESLRYVRPKDLRMTLVPGSELSRLPNLDGLQRALEATQAVYEQFAGSTIRAGMPFDEKKGWTSALRRILPDGIATNIVWSANHRALRWVLEMRTAPGAEAEMRFVFDKVGQILKKDYPLIYQDFERIPHEDGVGAQWVPRIRSKV